MDLDVIDIDDYSCWLSPTGKVTFCSSFGHYDEALDIIKEKGWENEYKEYGGKWLYSFMHNVKSYVRFSMGSWVWEMREPNTKQQERMYELTGFLYVGD